MARSWHPNPQECCLHGTGADFSMLKITWGPLGKQGALCATLWKPDPEHWKVRITRGWRAQGRAFTGSHQSGKMTAS